VILFFSVFPSTPKSLSEPGPSLRPRTRLLPTVFSPNDLSPRTSLCFRIFFLYSFFPQPPHFPFLSFRRCDRRLFSHSPPSFFTFSFLFWMRYFSPFEGLTISSRDGVDFLICCSYFPRPGSVVSPMRIRTGSPPFFPPQPFPLYRPSFFLDASLERYRFLFFLSPSYSCVQNLAPRILRLPPSAFPAL